MVRPCERGLRVTAGGADSPLGCHLGGHVALAAALRSGEESGGYQYQQYHFKHLHCVVWLGITEGLAVILL